MMLLMSGVVFQIFGSSSSGEGAMKLKHMLMQPKSLDEQKVSIALECLPETLKSLKKGWDGGHISSTCMLFYGPPGTGKKTAARALGQKYFASRSYFFRLQSFIGDRYRNNGKEVLRANLLPIIKKASKEKQYIVIDGLHQLTKKQSRNSWQLRILEADFWQIVDEMMDTGNIALVGTCNKIDKLPQPISDRFSESKRHEFEHAPPLLYERLLSLYLSRAEFLHDITDDVDIREIAQKFDGEAGRVTQLVEEAVEIAYNRNHQNTVITKDDMFRAFREHELRNPLKKQNWKEWFQEHEREVRISFVVFAMVLMVVAAIAEHCLKKTNGECRQDALNSSYRDIKRSHDVLIDILDGIIDKEVVNKVHTLV